MDILIWDFTKFHNKPTFWDLLGLFQDQINKSIYYSLTDNAVMKLVQDYGLTTGSKGV